MDCLTKLPILDWAGSLFQTEVAKMTIAFLVAARLHRKWIKQDIVALTDAINNVAKTVSQGLELHSKRIDELTHRVDDLEHNEVKPKQGE